MLNGKRPFDQAEKTFLLPEFDIFFKSPPGLNTIINMSGATAQQAVYIRDMKLMDIPVPPLSDQNEIVQRVQPLFRIGEWVEKWYGTLKEKMDQLPQAILSKTFRGELTKGAVKEYKRQLNEMEGMLAADSWNGTKTDPGYQG